MITYIYGLYDVMDPKQEKGFTATGTPKALDNPVFILKTPEAFGLSIAAMTVHFRIDFPRPKS